MSSLATLKAVAENWLAAEKRYKSTPNSAKLEQEAQEAFGEYVTMLDARTVLNLIDMVDTLKPVADNLIWLAQNKVERVSGPTAVVEQELRFTWRHPANDPQSLGEAIRTAMQQKSPILRVPG